MSIALDALTGWTLFGGLTLAVGCAATRWIVLRPTRLPAHLPAGRAWEEAARLGFAAASLVAMGVALAFVRQVIEFRDPFVPWHEDAWLLLTGTAWGRAWTWAAVGAVLSLPAFRWAAAGRRLGWALATPIVLVLGAFPAFTGHAAGESSYRSLLLAGDVLHVWAAGAWIGGLAVILHLERRLGGGREGPSVLPALVPPFSTMAAAGAGIVVITGAFAGLMHLPDLSALLDTAYGRALSMKLTLVGIVLALGATNFRVLTPRLGSDLGDRALRRTATLELVVAQAVLVITAILVRTPPDGM